MPLAALEGRHRRDPQGGVVMVDPITKRLLVGLIGFVAIGAVLFYSDFVISGGNINGCGILECPIEKTAVLFAGVAAMAAWFVYSQGREW